MVKEYVPCFGLRRSGDPCQNGLKLELRSQSKLAKFFLLLQPRSFYHTSSSYNRLLYACISYLSPRASQPSERIQIITHHFHSISFFLRFRSRWFHLFKSQLPLSTPPQSLPSFSILYLPFPLLLCLFSLSHFKIYHAR